MIKEINLNLKSTTREGIRAELVNEFLKEACGTGKKEFTSKYNYHVETVVGKGYNYKIVLKRPAYLNKGFDFIVSFPGHNFNEGLLNKKGHKARKNDAPSHPHITNDLKLKKKESPAAYQKVKVLIDKIYKCSDISDEEYTSLNDEFTKGLPVELILKLIKWLFIEQDITYWNFSGRAMLYGQINSL
jgi:hypothetical protein